MMTKKKMILQQKQQLKYTQVALGVTATVATGAAVSAVVNSISCHNLKKELKNMKQDVSIEMSGHLSEVSRLCEQNSHDINVLSRAMNMNMSKR